MSNKQAAEALDSAVDDALRKYFDGCRQRIRPFITKHYRYPGAWTTNKGAFGWDLLRLPLNLIWAPFYIVAMGTKGLSKRFGWTRLTHLLRRVRPGLTTDVQRFNSELIYRELLLWPVDPSQINPIEQAIVSELDRLSIQPERSEANGLRQQLSEIADDALEQLKITRTASADITNASFSTLIGALAFNKFAPGGIAIGLLLGAYISRQLAIDRFILGPYLGDIYYRFFPPDSTLSVTVLSIGLVLTLFAILASLSGLLSDPLQAMAGLHERRLRKLIDKVEQDVRAKASGSFRPKDQYLARVFDVLDAIRSSLL